MLRLALAAALMLFSSVTPLQAQPAPGSDQAVFNLQLSGDQPWGLTGLQVQPGTSLQYAPGLLQTGRLFFDASAPALPAPIANYIGWQVDTGSAEHAGPLQGNAPFNKLGQGVLMVSGDAANYTGLATVAQGHLAVNNWFGGAVQVDQHAQLLGAGYGLSAIRVLAGAGLVPGSPAVLAYQGRHLPAGGRVLSANGPIQLAPGSTLHIRADESGGHTGVHTFSQAQLAGLVQVDALPGDWQQARLYRIVHAESGVQGVFDAVQVNQPNLDASLAYSSDAVTLALAPKADVTTTPPGPKPTPVPDVGTAPAPVVVRVSPPKIAADSWAPSVLSGIWQDARWLRLAVLQHTGRASATQPVWAQLDYASQRRGAAGPYWADQRDTSNVVLGVSRDLSTQVRGSVFTGMQHSRARRGGLQAGARVDTAHVGVSLRGGWQAWQWAAGWAHSWHRVHSHRHDALSTGVTATNAKYAARTQQVFGQVAFPLALGAHTQLTPFVQTAWVRSAQHGFTESGPDAMAVNRTAMHGWAHALGLRMHTHAVPMRGGWTLSAYTQLAWHVSPGQRQAWVWQRYAGPDGHANPLTRQSGQGIARHQWGLQAGIRLALRKGIHLELAYAGHGGNKQHSHGVTTGLQVSL